MHRKIHSHANSIRVMMMMARVQYNEQYFGEITFFFVRTRLEILLSEPPRRFGPATAQTKALLHTTK